MLNKFHVDNFPIIVLNACFEYLFIIIYLVFLFYIKIKFMQL